MMDPQRQQPPKAAASKDLYNRIPVLVQLLLELSLACLVLVGGPFLMYYLDPNKQAWYSPYDAPPERSRKLLGPEVERWSTLLLVLLAGFIVSRRVSQLLTRVIGYIFRHHRKGLHKESLAFLELTIASSRYLFYFITALVFWGAVKALFPVPLDPRISAYKMAIAAGRKDVKAPKIQFFERPKYFHLETAAFVLVFYAACLGLEKTVLHSLRMYFGQTVYQERVAQCNYKLWVIKTLRLAYVRSRTGSTGGSNSTTIPGSLPAPQVQVNNGGGGIMAEYRDRQDDVAAFVMENAGAAQTPRDGLADLLFDHYSRRPDDFVVVPSTSDILCMEQLQSVFAKSELTRAFSTFDPTESRVTSREEFHRAIIETYAERWAILTGVTGHGKMVQQLDSLMKRLIISLTIIFIFFAYGIRMDNLTKILTFLMIPASRALRTFFSAITYIFTTHPYDVGDRVTVAGTHFFVQHVGLLFTRFRRMDGAVVYYPNYLLAGLAVNNIKRTPRQSARFDLSFDGESASPQKVGLLRQRIQEVLSKSGRDFSSGQTWFLQMPDASKLVLTLVLNHNTNQQEGHPWAMRNTFLLDTVREITADLGLQYRPPVRSLQAEDDINVVSIME